MDRYRFPVGGGCHEKSDGFEEVNAERNADGPWVRYIDHRRVLEELEAILTPEQASWYRVHSEGHYVSAKYGTGSPGFNPECPICAALQHAQEQVDNG